VDLTVGFGRVLTTTGFGAGAGVTGTDTVTGGNVGRLVGVMVGRLVGVMVGRGVGGKSAGLMQ